jgi:glucose-1-phosphate cytidylyltransferase
MKGEGDVFEMKVVILAGGVGSRLAEETVVKPKPMLEIGGRPILWHIMQHYSHHGFNEFVIALGYKGDVIKRYFLDYYILNCDLTVDTRTGNMVPQNGKQPDWRVHLVDTGLETQTGGRIKRMQSVLGNETFMLTYGDGVSNVDLQGLLAFHHSHGRHVTLTAVHPTARFGQLDLHNGKVSTFEEKPQTKEGWINGGFMVMEPAIFDYIAGDHVDLAREPMMRLADDGQLMAYQHDDFWQCMDTIRNKELLERLWQSGKAPWKCW